MFPVHDATTYTPDKTPKVLLASEFICVFFVLPILFTITIRGTHPFPFIVIGGLFAAFYLFRDDGFSRKSFGDFFSLHKYGKRILLPFFAISLIAITTIALTKPEALFDYPRHKTALWLAIIVLYPLLAVYPQELFYRAFFFRRYRSLFPGKHTMTLVSALTFGFAHIIYGNIPAVLLTLIGGYLFAITYQHSRSVLVASLEHALYGCLLYTIGFGQFLHTVSPM